MGVRPFGRIDATHSTVQPNDQAYFSSGLFFWNRDAADIAVWAEPKVNGWIAITCDILGRHGPAGAVDADHNEQLKAAAEVEKYFGAPMKTQFIGVLLALCVLIPISLPFSPLACFRAADS